MTQRKMPPADIDEIVPLLIGVWRRFQNLSGPPDKLQTREFRSVVEAVVALKEGLETGNALVGTDYFSKPDLTGAYLLYYWLLHYQQGLALINELPHPPERVLDLGAGLGPFSFAAMKQGASEVIAIDKNATALKLAGEVCGRYGFPLTTRLHSLLRLPLPVEGKFDLIIVGYCLEELFPDTKKGWTEEQKAWLLALSQKLTPEGHLLLVEGSQTHSNHRLLGLRDLWVKEGFPVQAPCVWKGTCPALQARSLCYAQRELEKPYLLREIQRAAQINLSSLKMSYLILKHPEAAWPVLPTEPLYRVISPPIDTHVGKRFHLCGTDGKKDLGAARGADKQEAEAKAFDYLKRGELISVKNAFARGDHLDIVPGTSVKVEAALNKSVD